MGGLAGKWGAVRELGAALECYAPPLFKGIEDSVCGCVLNRSAGFTMCSHRVHTWFTLPYLSSIVQRYLMVPAPLGNFTQHAPSVFVFFSNFCPALAASFSP